MVTNPYPGKFIVLEGIEGSGKTTQAALLQERMKKNGFTALLTKEPTQESIFGRLVRFVYTCESLHENLWPELEHCIGTRDYELTSAISKDAKKRYLKNFERIARDIKNGDHTYLPMLIQLGMIFDRHEHRVREEIPTLGNGTNVISDRDFFSTLAYGSADGIDWRYLLQIHEKILEEHFILPNLILLLDVPIELGLERTLDKQAGKKEYFDTPERMTKIQQTYYEIIKDPALSRSMAIIKIDGSRDKDTVEHKIWQIVERFMKGGK